MKLLETNAPEKTEVSKGKSAAPAALPTPFVTPFRPGDVIAGKYEVIKLIGAGGMGFVISATHVELRHEVALKFLRPELLVHRDLVARFVREARTAVMIKSEHVARVFDVGNLPDAGPFIAMELLEGQDLGRVLADKGALPSQVAVDYALQACEALATAHAAGVVHRDIKPENLFLTKSLPGMDVIKVLDFGISKVALTECAPENRLPFVRTMMAVGSPTYMSPEQIRASKDVDGRADIWALGCVLYELLTGTAAFDAPSLTQLSAKILEINPPPLRSVNPSVSPELEAVVVRCLEKDANKRFKNMGELAASLCPFASNFSRMAAERCRYVLDPAGPAPGEAEIEELGPTSWNGLSTGLDEALAKSPEPSTTDPVRRVTAAARRLAGDRRRFIPALAGFALVATVATFALSRALRSDTTQAAYTVPQTVLTAPAANIEPAARLEALTDTPLALPTDSEITPPPAGSEGAKPGSVPLVAARPTPAHLKAAPKRAGPPRSKNSTANEPDVGF